ncbi:ATP-dependent DNA helicase RecG [Actinotalea sp. BY-33]|uniref:Probable DNA 3'-5' helicase RecG n=1 Tax=Actinotalea soli TaxID=2819234 RepID=A0A939RV36_9CELL|nr:ATP-dependent DNA helicase RecG [Actinotalea soli]MBO1750746.1 ATP-dependent DNA helicase RecG [Actinotalea soli]
MTAEPDRLLEPLERVVGKRTAEALDALGVRTVGDLVRHYPRRYAEPGRLTDLSELALGEHVAVMAQVRQATVRTMRSRGGSLMQVGVTDGTHDLQLTFFAKRSGALRSHEHRLRPGKVALFTGTVGEYRGALQLTHPDYQVIGEDVDDEAAVLVEATRPIPIYPSSAALPTWRIQRAVRTVLDTLTEADLPDPVPAEILEQRGLVSLHEALRGVHAPFADADWRRGQARLRYEEAFVLQAALARRRAIVAAEHAVARPRREGPSLLADFDARLPFTLTPGQVEVGEQVATDLERPQPMQRLLQGEVGSGKTVVALRAMLQVVDAGGQAALLAPTEVLAAQHLRSLRALLGPLAEEGLLGGAERATRVVLLTGSQSTAARREALLDAASGRAGIVVGTHALLSPSVQFAELGLVVVDEQHRFGVEQRDALRTRAGVPPHLLVMTATPIPRTVAMTVFGDLETSMLLDVPAGRPGITTHVVPADNETWMTRTWQRVREEVDAGHRVYVVCPRISPDDPAEGAATAEEGWEPAREDETGPARPAAPLRAVLEVAEELAAMPHLAGVEVGVLHGRMPPAEKDEAMARFSSGQLQVLVATTVIEVGVDVPEATVMVILDADRFGLSQLHQLRGRVGRGQAPGLCLLVSAAAEGTDAATRVRTLAETTDGFRLAGVDLELRREGDVLGASQSGGRSSLRLLRVVRHGDVIAEARQDATPLVMADPDLARWPVLQEAIGTWLDPRREEFLDRA